MNSPQIEWNLGPDQIHDVLIDLRAVVYCLTPPYPPFILPSGSPLLDDRVPITVVTAERPAHEAEVFANVFVPLSVADWVRVASAGPYELAVAHKQAEGADDTKVLEAGAVGMCKQRAPVGSNEVVKAKQGVGCVREHDGMAVPVTIVPIGVAVCSCL